MKKALSLLTTALTLLTIFAGEVQAQITNPVLDGALGDDLDGATSGQTFTDYFIQIWQAIIVVGGLAVLLYFVWGAVEWISAGGDSSKIEKARNRITQAVIGMIILVGSFTIIGVISTIFFGDTYNLLAPQF